MTKPLPGDRWLQILTAADCRVEVSQHEDTILSNKLVKDLIGKQCDGVIGQLTEVRWSGVACSACGQGSGKPSGSGGLQLTSRRRHKLQCCGEAADPCNLSIPSLYGQSCASLSLQWQNHVYTPGVTSLFRFI